MIGKAMNQSQNILYYSTNRHLEGTEGLTPFNGSVSFKQALLQGQAPDEGLFMPDSVPFLPYHDIAALKDAPYSAAAMLVAKAFLRDEIPDGVLQNIVADSYNGPTDGLFPKPERAPQYPRGDIGRHGKRRR
jgi:threonine synthase